MNDAPEEIGTLSDPQAVRVLALVLDRVGRLPDPAHLRELDAQLRKAEMDGGPADHAAPSGPPPSAGEIARATLTHMVAETPELSEVVRRAGTLATDTTRFDPATLAIGGLVLVALQTEVDLRRDAKGEWRLRIHKKALRDSTLGRLLAKLVSHVLPPS
jgi:hypothetical protein